MNRLTQNDDMGNWLLSGVYWEDLQPGRKITRQVNERLYGALYKLMKYEDTGLSPDQIVEMDELYAEKGRELKRLRERIEQLKHAEVRSFECKLPDGRICQYGDFMELLDRSSEEEL